jgi:glucose-1-phosphate cytidylyltransferase
MIKDYFLNYEAWNSDFTVELGSRNSLTFHDAHNEAQWKVTIAYTGETTMTGGRLFLASRYLDDQPFLVTYGDGLADVDITALRAFHEESRCIATVTTVQPMSRFGVMDVGSNGKVLSFKEKPKLEGWINIGFFVMQPQVIEYLDADCILEEAPLARLASDGELSAFRHEGFWQPMDTFRESKLLNDLWESDDPPWRNW